MFDEPPSLPMRAAIASFLGALFGIGLILATHSAQAQTAEPAAAAATASPASSVVAETGAVIKRLGDATLRTLRGPEPAIRGLRINAGSSEVSSGLRWQVARLHGLRSEGDIPRSRDIVSVGVQVRF